MTKQHLPPPTKFGPQATIQGKLPGGPGGIGGMAPPPVSYGPVGTAQRALAVPTRSPSPLSPGAVVQTMDSKSKKIAKPGRISGFDSKDKSKGQIYGIWRNPQYPKGKIEQSDMTPDLCIYVGKTIVNDVGDRFIQHVNEDRDKPWFRLNYSSNPDAYQKSDEYWPYVPRQFEKFSKFTKFDVAVAEQFWIQHCIKEGAELMNTVNAITVKKFLAYKTDPSVYTSKKLYGSWEIEDAM
jgi:hypothetical protein